MLYPDWENTIILYSGPFQGSSLSGNIPDNGLLISYMRASSEFYVGRNGSYSPVNRHYVGDITYGHSVLTSVPVKKGDNWNWVNGGYGCLHFIYLVPYK